MIKVAHIIPTDFLPQTTQITNFPPYQIQLLLAHQVLKDKKYLEYYIKRKELGDYIILDNSAFEFGEALSTDLLEKAINLTLPNEFVLPDVLFDKNKTIEKSIKFANNLNRKSIKYMAVVQGNTLKDWLACYEYFSQQDYVFSIGLGAIYSPKTIFNNKETNNLVSGREFLINQLKQLKLLNSKKPHHLLGLGDSGHLEIKRLAKYKWIRSCDSNTAYINAKYGIELVPGKEYLKIKEKINLDDKFNESYVELMTNNMQVLNEAGCRN